jgi:hypothetical protein
MDTLIWCLARMGLHEYGCSWHGGSTVRHVPFDTRFVTAVVVSRIGSLSIIIRIHIAPMYTMCYMYGGVAGQRQLHQIRELVHELFDKIGDGPLV